ncbi:ankyrin repeat domain-containing protein [Cupriavidus sp. AU9028]|uniref:ankyrin repeat domain-containing protein n=1 Tax=Cupriavidus sp. AU9028 TaxID=2871157 RepID=UPI001C9514EB|nr:ankyrin repeat domain-containing protein [Cupriavidus sp. AU9028]MBY4896499.1 ankyrin repeat domain-containing protein [Cupriavidus sp. AU9028]
MVLPSSSSSRLIDMVRPLDAGSAGSAAALPGPAGTGAAALNAGDADGNTALHHAVLAGADPDMLDWLLRHDADPTRANAAGDTPLHLAFAMRPPVPQAVRMMVRHLDRNDAGEACAARAVLVLRNRAGLVPAALARGNNAGEAMLGSLVRELAGDYRRWLARCGAGALTTALECGDAATVRQWLADPQWLQAPLTTGGHDALAIAAAHGHTDIVRLLLQAQGSHRAAVPAADLPAFAGGETALMCAAAAGQPEAAAALIEAGARVDATDSRGRTPLMLAALFGDAGMVRLLLQAGARRDPREGSAGAGWTALCYAAAGLHAEAVDLLVDGAQSEELQRRDAAMRTPLLLAARSDELQGEGGSRAATLSLLLQAGASPEVADMAGMTPLMYVGQAGDMPSARRLLQAGASLTPRDATGRTAAELADGAGHAALARMLQAG